MTVRHRGVPETGQPTKQGASLSSQPTQGERQASILADQHYLNILTSLHLWSNAKTGFLHTAPQCANPLPGSKPTLPRWPWHMGRQAQWPCMLLALFPHLCRCNAMHLALCARPAAWHQIHSFWQFVTSLKLKGTSQDCLPSLSGLF